jgi:hypothetical protein
MQAYHGFITIKMRNLLLDEIPNICYTSFRTKEPNKRANPPVQIEGAHQTG